MAPIDHNFDMQAIVTEQVSALTLGHQIFTRPAFQRGLPAGDGAIEERADGLDHRIAADLIIAAGPGRHSIKRVGAVIGVIEAAPAGIGGIEQEPRIEHWYHQLRPGHRRDFCIDVLGADLERRRFGNEVADFAQEGLVFSLIDRFSGAGDMPGINLRLQIIALGQQRAIDRYKPAQQIGEARPERSGILAQRNENFAFNKCSQCRIDLQAGLLNPIAHETSHLGCGNAPRSRLDFHRFRGGMPAPMPQLRSEGNAICARGLEGPLRSAREVSDASIFALRSRAAQRR